MKLLSRPNHRIGDKVYRTGYISLRIDTVDELGWPWGQELDAEVDGNVLILRPRSLSQNAPAPRKARKTEKTAINTR